MHRITNITYTGLTRGMSDRVIITPDHSFYRTDRVEHALLYDLHCFNLVKELDPALGPIIEQHSRSFYDKNANMEGLNKYHRFVNTLEDIHCDESIKMKKAYYAAADICMKEFKSIPTIHSMDLLTQLDCVRYDATTAAGYGYIGKKAEPGGLNDKKATSICRKLIGELKDGNISMNETVKNVAPYIAHTRTQLTEYARKLKVRPVWGIPFHMFKIGSMTSQPYNDYFIEAPSEFYTIGKDPRTEVPRLINMLKDNFLTMETGDWANQDATTKEYEIREAFKIYESRLRFPNIESKLAFEVSRETFICKRIVDPYQRILIINTGTPSGHPWTQLIGTLCSRIRKITLLLLTMNNLKIVKTLGELGIARASPIPYTIVMLVGQGDDDLAGTDQKFNSSLMNYYAQHYDWPFNEDKLVSSSNIADVYYLQRTALGSDQVRDKLRCVLLLCLPEMPQVEPVISAFRAKALFDDQGQTSDILEKVSSILAEQYAPEGFANVVIPKMHSEYVPGIGHVRRFIV
jgi:hypothetical protein